MSTTRINDEVLKPIFWKGHALALIDQTLLPSTEQYHEYTSVISVAQAIEAMIVRGAPAIGITAAYGFIFALDAFDQTKPVDLEKVEASLSTAYDVLMASRPTAVNLKTALERMYAAWAVLKLNPPASVGLLRSAFEQEAITIHDEDLAFNYAMAEEGFRALGADTKKQLGVLTHCNTGSLATGGLGTALGIIKVGYRSKRIASVCITETRPWLQGSRLTAFELGTENIPFELMVEGAVGYKMRQGLIDWLIVGADRITANGDVANKIGTYALAVLAKTHGVKVMVAAPSTTLDFDLASGDEIPIELREGKEILKAAGYDLEKPEAQAINVFNPAFDITPAEYIDVIVTEKGACHPSELALKFKG